MVLGVFSSYQINIATFVHHMGDDTTLSITFEITIRDKNNADIETNINMELASRSE